ncbi:hypothetical protein [Methanoregula sp.]|uniref:hypothetical protein n=1 Tax=Methanoregula sp. TaxID=2052170 RepID=UPI003568D9D1
MQSLDLPPVIRRWFSRNRVQKLARIIGTGDSAAVRTLAELYAAMDDPTTRSLAGTALSSLTSPEQVDTLCREVLIQDSPALAGLSGDCNYLPSKKGDRALYLFCTGKHTGKTGTATDLALGYLRADATIRFRTRMAAKTRGTKQILARAISAPDMPKPEAWSYGEWETVVEGLSQEHAWDELWQVLPMAPLPHAVAAVTEMKNAGWSPEGDDRLVWDEIVKTLPDRWTYPSPACDKRPVIGRPAAQVSHLCISRDGSLLATASCDGMVALWRMGATGCSGEIVTGPVRFISISRDNRHLVSCIEAGVIQCHDLQRSILNWSRNPVEGEVTALQPSGDERTLLIGDNRGTLHILDVRDGRILQIVPLHMSPVTCLIPSPDGTAVACGHMDGMVSVAGIADSTVRYLPPGPPDPVKSVVFANKGTGCLVIHDRALPVLHDIRTATRTRVFSEHAGHTICSVASIEGGWFAIGSNDHTIRFWDIRSAGPAAVIPLYSRHATCCAATPDGRFFTAGFDDGTIRIYRMPDHRLVREYRGHKRAVTSCTTSSDGSRLATVSWDGTTKLWRIPNGEIIRTIDTHAGSIAALAGSEKGSFIAAVTRDGIARVLTGGDGSAAGTIDLYTPDVRTAAMSPDGMYLACAGADSTLRIWNVRNGSLTASMDKTGTSQRCCTFSPDGVSLITGGWDGIVRIFSIPEGKPGRTLAGHSSIVTCCAVMQNGSLIITGSNDKTVRIWRDGTETATVLKESRTGIRAVAISPEDTLLVAGGADAIIRLYHLPRGTPAGELPGIPGNVTALAFDHDGNILVVGYDTGICAYYAIHEQKLIRTEALHIGAITGIVVLPQEKIFVTSGEDGTCRFHPFPVSTFLTGITPADIVPVHAEADASRGSPDGRSWAFLYRILAARFRNEIQICPSTGVIGRYDIQIMG